MKRYWTFWRIPLLLMIAIACVAFVVLRAPQAMPQGVYATPTPVPTPTPFIPTPTPVPTPVPGAVSILDNGALVCTLASEEEADELLAMLLQHAEEAAPAGEEVRISAFDTQVAQRAAKVGEMPIPLEEAFSILRDDAQLLPVYIVTRQIETQTIPFETEQIKDKRIPHGSRIVAQVGRTGVHSVVTMRTYLNGVLAGQPVVEENTLAPTPESILVGTYIAETPDGTPGRSEGSPGRAGPEGFPLSLPVEGAILSNFGTRERTMHYGIDIACDVGDAVHAPGDGVVVFVGQRSSYGTLVEIAYGDGFVTRLAPLQNVSIAVGAEVTRGQQIGALSPPVDEEKQPHLHMELLIDGLPYNPRQYLL